MNVSEKEAENSPRFFGILPTIKFLIKNGAKVVILSHRGRPLKVQSSRFKVQDYSLKPFAKILSSLLNKPIRFVDFDKGWKKVVAIIDNGSGIFLLENLRFLPGEEKNDVKLAKQLASLGDFYVNDAFGVDHRPNASVAAIAKFLPNYAGLLLEKEINNLSAAMKNPKHPLVVILGGAKISDKIGMIENFKNKADYFLIGGGIAHNFLLAQGLPIGDSIFEEKSIGFAKKMLKNKKVVLPFDYVVNNRKILDIGPETAKKYSEIIKKAKTIVWNGPLGMIEDKRFLRGSEAIVKAIFKSRAFAIIGGGETTVLFKMNSGKETTKRGLFLSTGGGATLEYLAGKKLPGIEALK